MRGSHYLIIACLVFGCFWTESLSAQSFESPTQLRPTSEDDVAIDEIPIDDFDRDHWAYRPLEEVQPPEVNDTDWPRSPIDHFILKRLEAKSIVPAAACDRTTWIRRVTFGLTGLPPEVEEVDAFLADQKPDAYERVVDRLLASPQYAQRWAQHWLDLARFAETDGFEHDKERPAAWKYRDWVIDTLASDMPYDRFIRLQIAGDLIEPGNPEAQIATAFCLSGPDMPDINSMVERKDALLNDVTSTVGSVVMSLQMGCAQCHDHKFDAISQADFYRLRAFFETAVKLKRNQPVETLDFKADPEAEARLFLRGDWRRPGPAVEADFIRVVSSDDLDPDLEPPRQRLELASWLTHPDHPLTARSIVNRLWQYHFGTGISSTPSDFGVMGQEPSHPRLLDYLASRLIEQDWSLKKLHGEIVLSATYRLESKPPVASDSLAAWQDAGEIDPQNRLHWRFDRQRLDGEVVRDAMLTASGQLHHAYGGPGVRPPLPEEMKATLLKGQWQTSDDEADHHRRSVYVFARRNLRYPLFATFDRPAANSSCPQRHQSTTAIQSLLLLNSKFALDASRELAKIASTAGESREAKCREVYQQVLSRRPTDRDIESWVTFCKQQTDLLKAEGHPQPEQAALIDLCRAAFNSNAFLYVD